MAEENFFVVIDFDGTITQKDIGNELCLEVIPDLFRRTHAEYKAGKVSLKDMQHLFWSNFPMNEKTFIEKAMSFGQLREGANAFFENCFDQSIPLYVASCGLRPYIEPVLKAQLSTKAFRAIRAIRCNEVEFGPSQISKFTPPESDADSPYPLHKGRWCQSLKKNHPGLLSFAVGNGSSDRSFVGFVDTIAATEGLAKYCQEKEQPYFYFESFFDILKRHPWFCSPSGDSCGND